MTFLIRNDDVAFDTDLEHLKRFCEICDKYGFKIIQAITPIGEVQEIKSRMTNEQIRGLSGRLFFENKEVWKYLRSRQDFTGVHGLFHTHKPNYAEVETAKFLLQDWDFNPKFFVPPFNEGEYQEISGLRVCQLGKKERLEEQLEGTPTAPIMYLHSWRFNNNPYTLDMLDKCLARLCKI